MRFPIAGLQLLGLLRSRMLLTRLSACTYIRLYQRSSVELPFAPQDLFLGPSRAFLKGSPSASAHLEPVQTLPPCLPPSKPIFAPLFLRAPSAFYPLPRLWPQQMRSIHAFLKLQADLEALELSFHGERPPLPGSSVLPVDTTRSPKLPSAATAPGAGGTPSSSQNPVSDSGAGVGGVGTSGACSAPWSLPCVSVDAEGNSYFSDKTVALGVDTGSGIGALSGLIPTTGEGMVYGVL